MAGPLADIYSTVDSAKRRVIDALRNPGLTVEQVLGNANDQAREHLANLADASTEAPLGPKDLAMAMRLAQGYNPVGIVSPAVARTLNTAKAIQPNDLMQQAIAGTPGAQMVDDGLLLRVQRNQVPDQALNPSVRGGVFYLPEGAAQAKHYSTGKSGYGGKEKIAGETLVSNPLFVKGATGGKAPESAYDSLLGKGAYQKMRADALRVRLNPSLKGAIHPDEFLAQYAPELEGMGEYIYNNSRQGNQLAYALQEAAVGSKVRESGHDAVLGYSKGKQGPFISEIFDVREMNYPDKLGTPTQIWDEYLPKKQP